MKRNKASSIILLAVSILSGTSAYSGEFILKGTTWERAAASAACKPDPLLLYSLALQESGHAVKRGRLQKLSATPDRFGKVLPCPITNSASPSAPRSRLVC
ncbi:hypothetical protein FCG41_05830 [Azotobacter chroococcum]|nr:hypothetical protein FCG41_05830 [Azotobacter chroococcum]